MKKVRELRRVCFGRHETGDDIRYRYLVYEGRNLVAIECAQSAPSAAKFEAADQLPIINSSNAYNFRKEVK